MIKIAKKEFKYRVYEGDPKMFLESGFGVMDDYSKIIEKYTDSKDLIRFLSGVVEDKYRDLAIIMKDPYRSGEDPEWEEDSVVVGPTFAALLLKEYDLAAKCMKWEKKLLRNGRVATVDSIEQIIVSTWTDISQLFLVDSHIPPDLATRLHKKLLRKGDYNLDEFLFENNYIRIVNEKSHADTSYSFGYKMSGDAYYGKKLANLRRNYPRIFEHILSKIPEFSHNSDMSTDDWSVILRMICRDYTDDRYLILKWFEGETISEYKDVYNMIFHELSDRYIRDVKVVFGCIKEHQELLPRFIKAVALMASVTHSTELETVVKRCFSVCTKRIEMDDIVLDLVSDHVFKLMKRSDEESCLEDISLKQDLMGENYLDYLTALMRMYKRYTKKAICLKPDSITMNNLYSVVNIKAQSAWWPTVNSNPFVYDPFADDSENAPDRDDILRPFREKMKIVLNFIDTILPDGINIPESETYINSLFDIGDEELIVQNFDIGILKKERADEYIKKAINKDNISLIPAVMAFSPSGQICPRP